jgi:hypothetical protein
MLYTEGCFFPRLADMLPELLNKSRHYLFVSIFVRALVTKCPSAILTDSAVSATDKTEDT